MYIRPINHFTKKAALIRRSIVLSLPPQLVFPGQDLAYMHGVSALKQGLLKGRYHCTIDFLFYWLGIRYMTTNNFCFYL